MIRSPLQHFPGMVLDRKQFDEMPLVRGDVRSDFEKSRLPAATAVIANGRSTLMLTLALEQLTFDPLGDDREFGIPLDFLVDPGSGPEPMPQGFSGDVADEEDEDCQGGFVISSHRWGHAQRDWVGWG